MCVYILHQLSLYTSTCINDKLYLYAIGNSFVF